MTGLSECADGAVPPVNTSDGQITEKYCGLMAGLAEQAAADGYYGLQDAALLIAEALGESASETITSGLALTLAALPEIFNNYRSGYGQSSQEIIKVLSHPDLQIELTEDEFVLLEAQLVAEMGEQAIKSVEEIQDNEAIGEDLFDAEDWLVADDAPDLSKAVQELAELLVMEAALIERQLAVIDPKNPQSVAESLARVSEELERYINASQMAGFDGLALICGQVNANIRLFEKTSDSFTDEQLDILKTWIGNVKDYLSAVNETDAALPLLAQLGSPDWPLPVSMDDAAVILMQLQNVGANIKDQEQENLKLVATPEDIALDLPDDVNQELLDILLQELPVQTQQFSAAIQGLQAGGGLADLEIAQRVAHTVKGAANTVGIKGIAELTHYLEDILVACAESNRLPGHALLNVLIAAADCLEGMSESLGGFIQPPDDALMVLQTVLDWANRINLEGIEQIGALLDVESDSEFVEVEKPAYAPVAESFASPAAAEKTQAPLVRVAAEQLDALFRLAGENIILNSQANERLRRMKNQLQAMETQFGLLLQLADELEQLVDLKDLNGRSSLNLGSMFDTLEMDQYNELHTASRRMVEAAFDAREINLDTGKELEEMGKLLDDQQRLVNESQETIMKTRLVPVSSITHRLQRSLRQTCRLTDKQCDLSLTGEQLMVDGNTLNTLIDPLMHLLRNAVDHGIENEPERLAAGKPTQGKIAVEFDREGNDILVRVSDDGRGLDYAAIREAAERRGAIQPGHTVSEEELKRLILRPNFSTRTETTQISGRGVGMDAVHFQVLAQGGSLALQSRQGQGLTVEMRIPLPLSRAHALLTHIGPYRLAISSKGIRQILFVDTGGITVINGEKRLQAGEDSYPVMVLAELLHIPEYSKPLQSLHTVLLVQGDGQTMAVLLDAVTDSLDIVIKNLGYYLNKIPGYTGAAILGDGSVAPVLDIPELLRTAGNTGEGQFYAQADTLPATSTLPTVLVVDDSLSQRRALEQLLQDAGFQVKTARDGMEAADQLAEFRPDIVLTDLEMPRMNGIELASHIRARENLSSLPVIMITSRTTQAHRKMAEEAGINLYLVKPVREDDLLATMQDLLDAALI